MAIREATVKDYDALVEFWNRNSGWDNISRDTWEDRFINAPYGPSVILIVENRRKIIAQLVFVLLKVSLGNKEVSGCRPFASVVDNSVKGLRGYLYIIKLFSHGFKLMKKKGYDLCIALPDPRWKYPLQSLDVLLADFPLFKKLINAGPISQVSNDTCVEPIDFDNDQIDDLWNDIKAQNVFMIVRDREALKWKNSHRDYKLIGVYQNNNLVGVATYIEKLQDKQIQICDVLVPNVNNQEMALRQISNFINNAYFDKPDFKKIVVLVTETFRKSLIKVGYVPDDYNFLFGIKIINKKIKKKVLNLSNWYLSAND